MARRSRRAKVGSSILIDVPKIIALPALRRVVNALDLAARHLRSGRPDDALRVIKMGAEHAREAIKEARNA